MAYRKAYHQRRWNDGSGYREKQLAACKVKYARLAATEKGRELCRKRGLESYHRRMRDPEKAKRLRETQRIYRQRRKRMDPAFAMRCHLRSRLCSLVGKGRAWRKSSSLSLVGCTVDELVQHIQAQFRRGMSWANYGKVWHVDHIVPCAKFDMLDPRQQTICFNYLNLRPCFARENLQKKARILQPTQLPLGI